MISFTSLSDQLLPRFAIKLLATAVLTWIACAAYTLWFNPEVQFFCRLASVQDAWSERMNREHNRKVVVFGGSSCSFSIMGDEILGKYGLATVNRGLAAGMGIKVPALNAMQDLRAGDTVIVALEPGNLTTAAGHPSLATEFSCARGHPQWVTQGGLGLEGNGVGSTLISLRPGSYHAWTLIAKLLQGRALYRYKIGDVSASGWVRTDVKMPISGPPGHGPKLSEDAKRFLGGLRDWCLERQVRVAYSLPWGYTPESQLESFKKSNAEILLQIAEFIPVLKEPGLGAHTRLEDFADTSWHLNEHGSLLRSDELGRTLKNWDLWAPHELRLSLSEGK